MTIKVKLNPRPLTARFYLPGNVRHVDQTIDGDSVSYMAGQKMEIDGVTYRIFSVQKSYGTGVDYEVHLA